MFEDTRNARASQFRASEAGTLSYIEALTGMGSAAALADPSQKDLPLVFVNDAFVALTGYTREEVIGRNCRFLQGPDTDRNEIEKLRQAIDDCEPCSVELKNYRKDGTPFWNALHVTPIFNARGDLIYFHAAQHDVTHQLAPRDEGQLRHALSREMHHRVKNLLAVAASIVRLTARGTSSAQSLSSKATRRIEALGQAHAATFSPTGNDNDMADILPIVKAMLAPFSGGERGCFSIKGKPLQLPIQAITPVALALHELGANAAEHGCLQQKDGMVHVSWTVEENSMVLVWCEQCEADFVKPEQRNHGFGMRAVDTMLAAAGARIEHDWDNGGLSARIVVPLA